MTGEVERSIMNSSLTLTFALVCSLCGALRADPPQPEPPADMRLHLPGSIDKSLDAIPLGNGLSGGLLWGTGTTVNLSLDRGDLWDLRPHPSYTR